MCEPAHSIIQFSLRNYTPNSGDYSDNAYRIRHAMRQSFAIAVANGRETSEFLTYSMMGYGHSEGIKIANMPEILPDNAKYEALWWKRDVIVDTPAQSWDSTPIGIETKQSALTAAREYANKSSIGNLVVLRKFLGESILYTQRPLAYVERSYLMFNRKGQFALQEELEKLQDKRNFNKLVKDFVGNNPKDMGIKATDRKPLIDVFNKLTAVREYMVPEWADDADLWLGGKKEQRGDERNIARKAGV